MKYLIYIVSISILSTSISFAATTSNTPSNTTITVPTITVPTKSQVVDTITTAAAPVEQSLLAKLDAFRIEKKLYLEAQRDEIKNRVATQLADTSKRLVNDSLGVDQPDPANIGQTSGNNLGNPQDYIMFTIYAGLATVFENSFYFYAVCVVLAFTVIRVLFRRAF